MSETSPVLSLPLLQPAQAQKHVIHNEALLDLETVVQLAVEDRTRTVPPDSPQAGARHIVAAGASGDWAGRDGAVAMFDGYAWRFVSPRAGGRAEVLAEGREVIFDGVAWSPRATLELQGLGLAATPDETNRLVVSAPASLFSHDGAGHQLKINKSAVADTGSLLFQTGWSGRAEIGLSGSDDLSVKVSADGAAWTEVLRIDGASGQLTGAAVQTSATDVTAGRLMRADYGYGPGNLLGPVSQAGGVPDGAVIESGANANGDYVRFADGTQICANRLDVSDITTAQSAIYLSDPVSWTYPAVFTGGIGSLGGIAEVDSAWVVRGGSAYGTTTATFRVARADTVTATFDLNVFAIGRWF